MKVQRSTLAAVLICLSLPSVAGSTPARTWTADPDVAQATIEQPTLWMDRSPERIQTLSSDLAGRYRLRSDNAYGVVQSLLTHPLSFGALDWQLQGQWRVAQVHYRAPDALALRLGILLQGQPERLEIQFFSAEQTAREGAQLIGETPRFSSLLAGDEIGIEFRLPLDAPLTPTAEIRQLDLIYVGQNAERRDLAVPESTVAGSELLLNASCQLPELQNEIDATVLLLIPDGRACSGNFIAPATTYTDPPLYILTAAHCLATPLLAANTEVILDYQLPCEQPFKITLFDYLRQDSDHRVRSLLGTQLAVSGLPDYQRRDDGLITAEQTDLDFTLLSVSPQSLPSGSRIRQLGWPDPEEPVFSGIANTVSHPKVYAKSFAQFELLGPLGNTQAVVAEPLQGIILPGSSGSALINAQEQLLGVLSAGFSEPPYTTYFASFSRAWHQGLCQALTNRTECDGTAEPDTITNEPSPSKSGSGGPLDGLILVMLSCFTALRIRMRCEG